MDTQSPVTAADVSAGAAPRRGALGRRGFLKAAGIAVAAGAVGARGIVAAPQAAALGPILGTVVDYAAGVPSASAIKADGHLGAVRYVSQRRPDAQWMQGKPVTAGETAALAAAGLATASVYQYGRAETADWLEGAAGAHKHATQAIALHKAAGGPTGRPIYIAIDDNPTRAQYDGQIRPYLKAFAAELTRAGYGVGVYGNYNVIDWVGADGIGSFFWMHDWGSGGKIHPRTTIHQLPQNMQRTIDGVKVDINHVYAKDWGQWTPGKTGAGAPAPAAPGAPAGADALGQLSSRIEQIPGAPKLPRLDNGSLNFGGSSVTPDQIRGGLDLIKTVQGAIS